MSRRHILIHVVVYKGVVLAIASFAFGFMNHNIISIQRNHQEGIVLVRVVTDNKLSSAMAMASVVIRITSDERIDTTATVQFQTSTKPGCSRHRHQARPPQILKRQKGFVSLPLQTKRCDTEGIIIRRTKVGKRGETDRDSRSSLSSLCAQMADNGCDQHGAAEAQRLSPPSQSPSSNSVFGNGRSLSIITAGQESQPRRSRSPAQFQDSYLAPVPAYRQKRRNNLDNSKSA